MLLGESERDSSLLRHSIDGRNAWEVGRGVPLKRGGAGGGRKTKRKDGLNGFNKKNQKGGAERKGLEEKLSCGEARGGPRSWEWKIL